MASQTLAEAGKLIQDDLVRGVAQDIITVNPIFERLPFEQFTGQAIVVNRENALGDAGFYAVNSTITHKTAATYTQATYSPTSIIGDAEVNGLVQATSESDGVDQMGLEISSKSKNIGRLYQQGMATGDGSAPNMNSLHTLVDSSQYTTASATQALSFALLDELLDLVTIKNGQVDFIMMHRRTMRSFRALVRALGGVDANTIVAFEGTQQEQKVLTYSGVPVYRNDYLSIVETANGGAVTGGALASVYAGCFDDGSRKVGIAGMVPKQNNLGIVVEEVGPQEAKDTNIARIKWYTNFVSFNRRGVARLTSVSN